jgi:hypothetical protein
LRRRDWRGAQSKEEEETGANTQGCPHSGLEACYRSVTCLDLSSGAWCGVQIPQEGRWATIWSVAAVAGVLLAASWPGLRSLSSPLPGAAVWDAESQSFLGGLQGGTQSGDPSQFFTGASAPAEDDLAPSRGLVVPTLVPAVRLELHVSPPSLADSMRVSGAGARESQSSSSSNGVFTAQLYPMRGIASVEMSCAGWTAAGSSMQVNFSALTVSRGTENEPASWGGNDDIPLARKVSYEGPVWLAGPLSLSDTSSGLVVSFEVFGSMERGHGGSGHSWIPVATTQPAVGLANGGAGGAQAMVAPCAAGAQVFSLAATSPLVRIHTVDVVTVTAPPYLVALICVALLAPAAFYGYCLQLGDAAVHDVALEQGVSRRDARAACCLGLNELWSAVVFVVSTSLYWLIVSAATNADPYSQIDSLWFGFLFAKTVVPPLLVTTQATALSLVSGAAFAVGTILDIAAISGLARGHYWTSPWVWEPSSLILLLIQVGIAFVARARGESVQVIAPLGAGLSVARAFLLLSHESTSNFKAGVPLAAAVHVLVLAAPFFLRFLYEPQRLDTDAPTRDRRRRGTLPSCCHAVVGAALVRGTFCFRSLCSECSSVASCCLSPSDRDPALADDAGSRMALVHADAHGPL